MKTSGDRHLIATTLAVLFAGCAHAPTPAPAPPPIEEDEAPPPEPAPEPEPAASTEPVVPLPSAADLAMRKAPDPNAPPDLQQPPADARRSESGLAWKVLAPGTGKVRPSGDDTVAIRHTGWMANGVKFESSADSGQAVEYVLSSAIRGWVEGLSGMVTGEKRRFWIPGSLAHGDQPRPYGLPHGALVYDIELVAIRHPPKAPDVPDDLTSPPADATRTASGLVYRMLARGTGQVHPTARSTVEVHYTGWTQTGERFDSSHARGQPATFSLGQVIRGWTEALQLFVVGDKARVWIPAKLAYGEKPPRGSPAGPLVFDIELLAIK